MKIKLIPIGCLLTLPLLSQTDSARLLPSTEITAQRLNRFSIGQTQMQSDSASLSLYKTQSLADFLQSETPLSIKAYGTGVATVAVRGMAANHTAILWNGINLQNPLNGLSDLAILSLGTTHRIGIKMGGGSALFGSGAIGGVVYLENEKPQQEGFHARLSYGRGRFDWENGQAQFDFTKKKWGGSVQLSQQKAVNDFEFRNSAEVGKPLQRASFAAYQLGNLTAHVFGQLSEKDFLKIHFWHSRNFREILPTMTSLNNHAVLCDTANRSVVEWTHFFKKSFLKMRGAYLIDKNAYGSDFVPNSQNGVSSLIGEMEWNRDFSAKHSLRAGINTTHDESANNNYTANHRRSRYAFFLNEAIQTDFVNLSANVRQEWLDKFQPTTFSVGFEKNLGKKTAKTGWILRGALSRNFNIPTFNDLYWAELGNPNLETEQGWSKELGLSLKTKTARQQVQAHITFFDINIQNRIAWLPQPDGQWRPNNIERVLSRGLETWLRYQFEHQSIRYRMSLNYQFAHATDGKGGVQLFVPAHKGSLSASVQYRKLYAAWQQTASSKRYAATDKILWTNPFTVTDATIGFIPPSVYRHKKNDFDLKTDLSLRVSNLFNADYQVIPFYANARRQYRLVFSLFF